MKSNKVVVLLLVFSLLLANLTFASASEGDTETTNISSRSTSNDNTYISYNTLYHKGKCVNCNHETNLLSHMWVEYSATYWKCRECGLLKIREIDDFSQ